MLDSFKKTGKMEPVNMKVFLKSLYFLDTVRRLRNICVSNNYALGNCNHIRVC